MVRGKFYIPDESKEAEIVEVGELNQDATIHSYLNYIWLQLRGERECVEKYVTSDRSLVDFLAYIKKIMT